MKILLRTKHTLPTVRNTLILRDRLRDTLLRVLEVPLTLVSAPPGFGKTTAVLMMAQEFQSISTVSFAWLSLDEYDNEPSRFWRYVIAALQTTGHNVGEQAAVALTAMPIPPLLAELLNDIGSTEDHFVLVLDDYHLINQQEIHSALAFMIEYAPPNLHLVLTTRADPPLPLHRMRARGQVLEIRAADLRFDLQEAGHFLHDVMQVKLTSSEIARLTEQTEGWAAGLQLAGLALQGNHQGAAPARRGLIEKLSQSNRYIPEYLAEEVLAQQNESVQAFLLQTSILKRMCAPLCDAITQRSDGQLMLDDLARRNLFVSLMGNAYNSDDEYIWYRYHQLFADLLQGRLRQQQPERVSELYARAAAWYEQFGEIQPAIEYALTAEDYQRVVRLLDQYAGMFVQQGRVLTVEQWLQRLPEQWRRFLPRTNMAYAWALLLRGRYAEITPYLEEADSAIDPDDGLLRGELHALRATVASMMGQVEQALDHVEQALRYAQPEHLFVHAAAQVARAGALRVSGRVDAAIIAYEQAIPLCRNAGLPLPELLSRAHLGFLYMLQGRLRQAEAVTLPVLDLPVRHPAASAAYAALGDVLLEWNRLDESEQQIQRAIRLAQQSGHNAAASQSHVLLARLRRIQGDLPAAQQALDMASELVLKGVPAWVEPLLMAERIQLWLEQGAVGIAEQQLTAFERDLAVPIGHVNDMLPLMWAYVRLFQGRHAEALTLLGQLLDAAYAQNRQGRIIEILALRATVYSARGDLQAAGVDLKLALELAEPEGYVRTFLDTGPALASLLLNAGGDYARRLFDAFPPGVRQQAMASADLPEPLTDRELDVLRLMERGLTYQQMADELVVSINTVRHHVKGIYSKLHADTRTRALERARTLNLL